MYLRVVLRGGGDYTQKTPIGGTSGGLAGGYLEATGKKK